MLILEEIDEEQINKSWGEIKNGARNKEQRSLDIELRVRQMQPKGSNSSKREQGTKGLNME